MSAIALLCVLVGMAMLGGGAPWQIPSFLFLAAGLSFLAPSLLERW